MSLPLTKSWRSRIESASAELACAVAPLASIAFSLTNGEQAREEAAIRAYLFETVRRAGSVRTILYRDAGVPLHRMHVPGMFSLDRATYSEADLYRHISRRRRIIVSGNAGTGKSVFTKRLALRQLELTAPRFPILVEMRYIGALESSILHYIRDEILAIHFPSFDSERLDFLLKTGKVTLILDGFDETHFVRRDMYRQEIDFLSRRYPEMEIILSTRPEEETLGLEGFEVVRVLPLPLDAARKLVGKLAYEPSVQASFIDALPGIYKQHHELASNPLLLTMLLLTHDQVGEIPAKMHIFYNQAFETLVLKHDRLKSLYVRVTRCAIDLETLKKAYAYFCAVTYANFEISFSEARCVELLREALEFAGEEADAGEFLNDLLFSYSMLKRDGMYISFVHRSFQEFFCALFVSGMAKAELGRAFDQLIERESCDSCVTMLCDLAADKVLFGWAKPFLQRQLERVQRLASEQAAASFAREYYGSIRVTKDRRLEACGSTTGLAKLRLYMQIASDSEGLALLDKRSGNTSTKRMEAFFGSRDPFDFHEVEPTGEDEGWLRESWIDEQMRALIDHLKRALEWIEQMEEQRSEQIKISFAAPEKMKQQFSQQEFVVRGKPQEIKDRRTGEIKLVPQSLKTRRRVPLAPPRDKG